MQANLVVIGASYAGVQIAASVREQGHEGRVVMVGDEHAEPYHRPPLSKAFLAGNYDPGRLQLRSPAFFEEARIELRSGVRAVRVDRAAHTVELDDGSRLPYDKLAFATGARPRRLDCDGAGLRGVHYLRSLRDAAELAIEMLSARSAVVVGGGYIGLEVAASLVKAGVAVTVVEAAERVLARVSSPWMSAFVDQVHRDQGVRFALGRKVAAVRGEQGQVRGVELDDGTLLACDLVVAGIGIEPNVELAADCGLAVQGGILVDQMARTSDPDIVAAGDCASFRCVWMPPGTPACRIESVQNANDMARTAAATLVGRTEPHVSLPWFWSDQYDLKLQMAGLSAGATEYAVRGSVEQRKFSVFYFRGEHLAAVDSVNRPQDHMLARKLLAARVPVEPAQARDAGFDLKSLLASTAEAR
ncbi:pyridine nucleotide-disulfide oxidoreductase [Bordetella sp. H567]|uniref:NAD(P)/FAD-dependent oxidoreductase n=1 Tax=Bordetella sp. H567 TaxID=1697043 RepID=UPI00081C5686|nr:FAD-dependent oxidoreductase [Bordetella sp. H567]AOB30841.1 pyridine nucleotide-disulfide oxidoreductase [Bordetella sp. H567]